VLFIFSFSTGADAGCAERQVMPFSKDLRKPYVHVKNQKI